VVAVSGWLVLAVPASGCARHEAVQPDEPAPGVEVRSETRIGPDEAKARDRFLDLMSSKRFRVRSVPGMTRVEAEKALADTVAGLDPGLAAAAKVGKPQCLPNGCMLDVEFPDWNTYQRFNRVVVDDQASPFNRYEGMRFQSGRSPRAGGRFVVGYGLVFPVEKALVSSAGQ
jgi:hypothetical protein